MKTMWKGKKQERELHACMCLDSDLDFFHLFRIHYSEKYSDDKWEYR